MLSEKNVHANRKIVFLDTEFTGERQHTTLLSIALVTVQGEKIYLNLNDYDRSQVDPWITKNVIDKIDNATSVNSTVAAQKIHDFLLRYSEGRKIYIVSAGLTLDIILLIELYKHLPENNLVDNFAFRNLPNYLNHHHGIDLNTLLRISGWDLSVPREKYVDAELNRKHDALNDAEIVRLCFEKLVKENVFANFLNTLD